MTISKKNTKFDIDKYYLKEALKKALIAKKNGDIPVGAIIVYNENKKNHKMLDKVEKAGIVDGQVIASAYNKRNENKDATAHAEIIAISKACKKIKDFRLEDCTMYVTLEPCQMCAGAIVQSRIKRLVIGAKSIKSGSCGTLIDILNNNEFNHRVEIDYIDDSDCKNILINFFKEIRNGREK